MLDTTLKIAGLIDTILGIAVAVQNLRSPGKGLFSPLLTGCAIILALLIATFVIRSDNWRKYSFVKTFSYWFRRGPEDYYVREREIAFLYDSLTKFTYKKEDGLDFARSIQKLYIPLALVKASKSGGF